MAAPHNRQGCSAAAEVEGAARRSAPQLEQNLSPSRLGAPHWWQLIPPPEGVVPTSDPSIPRPGPEGACRPLYECSDAAAEGPRGSARAERFDGGGRLWQAPEHDDPSTEGRTDRAHPRRAVSAASDPAGSPRPLHPAGLGDAQRADHRQEGQRGHPGLFARRRTPQAMAALDVETDPHSIRADRPGAARRPRTSRRRAACSSSATGGEVPADLEALEALPGVGHKTASVVMAQAFGVPAFPVDTHIHRLAARWGLSDGNTRRAKTERDLKKVFPRDTWNRRHLQIIYFGREHCPARGHDLSRCPICSWAASKTRIREEARPRR